MHPIIVKCKECKKLFKIHPHEYYPGDPNYCRECNKKADGSQVTPWHEKKIVPKFEG